MCKRKMKRTRGAASLLSRNALLPSGRRPSIQGGICTGMVYF